MNKIINKTMDLDDLKSEKSKKVLKELVELDKLVNSTGHSISSWYGNINASDYYKKLSLLNRGYDYKATLKEELDYKYPSFLCWEICTLVNNIDFKKNLKVLDIGGSCSLFSLYLAYKGLDVTAIDLNESLVNEGNKIGKALNLKYKAICMDAEEYLKQTNERFDYITSVCVFEHIEINKIKRIIKLISEHISGEGYVGFTFDYRNPSKFVNINTPDDVIDQLVDTKVFKLVGNQEFYDNNINYLIHPFYRKPIFWKYKIHSIKKKNFSIKELFSTKDYNDYTFGAIVLRKNK